MTPYGYQQTHDYLDAHVAELARDLAAAHRLGSTSRRFRKGVGRFLVRVGAWMMPDKPELVSDTILVLPKQTNTGSRVRTAA